MKLTYKRHSLHFIKPAKTSKIDYIEKDILILSAHSQDGVLNGECAPLVHLSKENIDECENHLQSIHHFPTDEKEWYNLIEPLPSSLKFAFQGMRIEQTLKGQPLHDQPIKINGLIWMSSFDEMWAELEQKIGAGFSCIKIKIGQHDFDAECRFIEKVRKRYGSQIELRVDANGAFTLDDTLLKLKELNRFQLHSIEQPIAPGQWDAMEMICKDSPIAVGLDEELIGLPAIKQEKLLKKIEPQYLILKPSLHGGFIQCDEWIRLAQKRNTSWWATSALESNIGLNHIALWLSKYKLSLPQGLGTGSLFKENFNRPFYYQNDQFCWGE